MTSTVTFAEFLICSPFIVSGIQKAADFPAAVAEVSQLGLAYPKWTARAVIALQLAAPLLVLSGFARSLAALALAGFTIAATVIAHNFWRTSDSKLRQAQLEAFAEHVAIVGGLVLIAAMPDIGDSP